jgi:hypothetical protein
MWHMNPAFSNEMARQHIRDLQREAQAARVPKEPGEAGREARLTVRPLTASDFEQVILLAELDSHPVPSGPTLVAELDGELVAALPLDGGEAIADPFRRSADVVALLQLRARQIGRSQKPRRELLARFRHSAAPHLGAA